MSEFTMMFSTDNAAFVEGQNEEVARILREVLDMVENGSTLGPLYDYNGNAVGSWGFTLPEEEREPIEEPDEDDQAYNLIDDDGGHYVWSSEEGDWVPREDYVWDEEKADYIQDITK